MEFQIKSIEQLSGYYIYQVKFITDFGFLDGQIVCEEFLEFDKTYKIKFEE